MVEIFNRTLPPQITLKIGELILNFIRKTMGMIFFNSHMLFIGI